jgi:hypothetical protein
MSRKYAQVSAILAKQALSHLERGQVGFAMDALRHAISTPCDGMWGLFDARERELRRFTTESRLSASILNRWSTDNVHGSYPRKLVVVPDGAYITTPDGYRLNVEEFMTDWRGHSRVTMYKTSHEKYLSALGRE